MLERKLFSIGSILALSDYKSKSNLNNDKLIIKKTDIDFLENEIDEIDKNLSPISKFTIPGGHILISYLHIARCVCRRAERLVVELSESIHIDPIIVMYLNRLSDFLFVLSRKVLHDENIDDIPWKPKKQ